MRAFVRVTFCLIVSSTLLAQSGEDDYEYPSDETCCDDSDNDSSEEGVEGGSSGGAGGDSVQPSDGSGGFTAPNAPSLRIEGPGGLSWDMTPSYRTRYKGGTDYPFSSVDPNRNQGNNWFNGIPYVTYDSSPTPIYRLRFSATVFRNFDFLAGSTWKGRNHTRENVLVRSGFPGTYTLQLHDVGGKRYTFQQSGSYFRLSKIELTSTTVDGPQIHIVYDPSGDIDVLLKPNSQVNSERRKLKYLIISNKIVSVDAYEKDALDQWVPFHGVLFTYHDDVTGAQGSQSGDLVGIEEVVKLSQTNTWYYRRWVYKYYVGAFDSATNKGHNFQVKAVIGPESYKRFLADNINQPDLDIYMYKRTAAQVENYIDKKFEYYGGDTNPDRKRISKIEMRNSCSCSGSEGTYTYSYAYFNNDPTAEPSDFNTFRRQVTITRPNNSKLIIDYNKYGQLLNHVLQEGLTNPGTRRWIKAWRYNSNGAITTAFSYGACITYDDSSATSHTVNFHGSKGLQTHYTIATNNSVSNIQYREGQAGPLRNVRNMVFDLKTSGNRRRYIKTQEALYHGNDGSDPQVTFYNNTYHSTDLLRIRQAETRLPAVPIAKNGSGSATIARWDFFDVDGRHMWHKDELGRVTYYGYDVHKFKKIQAVKDINTASPPSTVPAIPSPPVEGTFNSNCGAIPCENILTEWTYDSYGRQVSETGPEFEATVGTGIATVRTSKRWLYAKTKLNLSPSTLDWPDAIVTIQYPHVDTEVFNAPLDIVARDSEGNIETSAQGTLLLAYRDDNTLTDDFDSSQLTVDAGFRGTFSQRTDFTLKGDQVEEEEIWTSAHDSNSPKHVTEYTYDSLGQRETTKNAVGTIRRWSYDVMGRVKTENVGTLDGGSGNMVLVQEWFYDDEENSPGSSDPNSMGYLTQHKLLSNQPDTNPRITSYAYDFRGRVTTITEPINVVIATIFNGLDQPLSVDILGSATLLRRTEYKYDSRGQLHEKLNVQVPLATNKFLKESFWYNERGQLVKRLYQGTILEKLQYDGVGRVNRTSISYDLQALESDYAQALNLDGDTVIKESRYTYDKTGSVSLSTTYERDHDGTGTGALAIANARAGYSATWFDKTHRVTHEVDYGTNGGVDMVSRPSGAPPSSSNWMRLVRRYIYTLKAEANAAPPLPARYLVTTYDTMGLDSRKEVDDIGRVVRIVENFDDDTPGPGSDVDRTTERTYNGINGILTEIAKAPPGGNDQVTEYIYGVGNGILDSTVFSNDYVLLVKHPTADVDQLTFGYNALGEVIFKKDQLGTEHVFDYDDRGRLIHDRVRVCPGTVDQTVKRISRTYDGLDRPIKVTSISTAVDPGTVRNELQYEYGPYSTITAIHQDWNGEAVIGTAPRVQFAYTSPTSGLSGLRRTTTTYPASSPSSCVVTNVYNTGVDDMLSRVSGRNRNSSVVFRDQYLGMGRLVDRQYGSSTLNFKWSLLGADPNNADNYLGLDRFWRIDDLKVSQPTYGTINDYQYAYNSRSQAMLRYTSVGIYDAFNEQYAYDNLGRITDRKIGTVDMGTIITDHECFTLDRSGNISPYFKGGTTSCGTTWTASYNISNEFTSWTQGTVNHDAAGNMSQKLAVSYKYDAWNRLTQATSGTIELANYGYNGEHQKLWRTNTLGSLPSTVYYYNDKGQIVEECDTNDVTPTAQQRYFWGTQYIDDLVSRGVSSAEYCVTDANFNVVTICSSSAQPLKRFIYGAYGSPKQLSGDGNSWQVIDEDLYLFTGRQWHKDHAQYDYRRRNMDPQFGSFVQRDSIGIWGDEANYGNAFRYAACDPVNKRDASGNQAGSCFSCQVDMGPKPCPNLDIPDDVCATTLEEIGEMGQRADRIAQRICGRAPASKRCSTWQQIADQLNCRAGKSVPMQIKICPCRGYTEGDCKTCEDYHPAPATAIGNKASQTGKHTIALCCPGMNNNWSTSFGNKISHELSHIWAATGDNTSPTGKDVKKTLEAIGSEEDAYSYGVDWDKEGNAGQKDYQNDVRTRFTEAQQMQGGQGRPR